MGVSPGPRAVDWTAVRAAADELPFRFAGVRAGGPLTDRSPMNGFVAEAAGDRQAAGRAIADAVATARVLGPGPAPAIALALACKQTQTNANPS